MEQQIIGTVGVTSRMIEEEGACRRNSRLSECWSIMSVSFPGLRKAVFLNSSWSSRVCLERRALKRKKSVFFEY